MQLLPTPAVGVRMVNDPFSGIAGGVVATTVMTLALFIADAFTGFAIRPFQQIAVLVGTPEDVFLGFVVFVAAGAVAWPLLFVALCEFLPGRSDATKGAVFASVLWLSFALAFSTGLDGLALATYLVVTWLAHVVYGLALGTVYDRLADRDTHLLTTAEGV